MDGREEKIMLQDDQQTVRTTSGIFELTIIRNFIRSRKFLICRIIYKCQNLYDLMG